MADPPRPPLPPFSLETAKLKVQAAEDAWNTKDPARVAAAYSVDSECEQRRNRGEFLVGRDAIREFLTRKWEKELDYKLRKYLWAFTDNRISVCFEYEYHNTDGQWFRAYGNENWEFDDKVITFSGPDETEVFGGYMRKRVASINEVPIDETERRIAIDSPVRNAWLDDQGVGLGPHPLGGGSASTY